MILDFSSSYTYAWASASLGLEVEEMGITKGMSKWDRNNVAVKYMLNICVLSYLLKEAMFDIKVVHSSIMLHFLKD